MAGGKRSSVDSLALVRRCRGAAVRCSAQVQCGGAQVQGAGAGHRCSAEVPAVRMGRATCFINVLLKPLSGPTHGTNPTPKQGQADYGSSKHTHTERGCAIGSPLHHPARSDRLTSFAFCSTRQRRSQRSGARRLGGGVDTSTVLYIVMYSTVQYSTVNEHVYVHDTVLSCKSIRILSIYCVYVYEY